MDFELSGFFLSLSIKSFEHFEYLVWKQIQIHSYWYDDIYVIIFLYNSIYKFTNEVKKSKQINKQRNEKKFSDWKWNSIDKNAKRNQIDNWNKIEWHGN